MLYQRHTFRCQQTAFPVQTAGEAAQPAVGGQHTVTGNHHRQRVGTAGPAHRADRLGAADLARNGTVTGGCAPGNFLQGVPDAALEIGAGHHIERRPFSGFPAGEGLFQRAGGEPVPMGY